ncbi:RBBP9/YdeN family alpha/beta hydrolase [Zavarzinia sp.]|uniref:RBBP9/YdeN family alpha/beta hydrolase n=1 Tax=Zavarzinia sp. TaxID=2027920 RepID=UPI003562802B
MTLDSPPYLIVPGLGNSGPGHWQSHWQAELPRARRLEQAEWERPRLADWLPRAIAAIEAVPGAVLVAHSLGCVLTAHVAAARPDLDIAGALLVAPADVEQRGRAPDFLADFAPVPRDALPFPAIVVASRNDPYMDFGRACDWAGRWGARVVDAGPAGHINVASGHGAWAAGRALLAELAPPRRRAGAAARLAAGVPA